MWKCTKSGIYEKNSFCCAGDVVNATNLWKLKFHFFNISSTVTNVYNIICVYIELHAFYIFHVLKCWLYCIWIWNLDILFATNNASLCSTPLILKIVRDLFIYLSLENGYFSIHLFLVIFINPFLVAICCKIHYREFKFKKVIIFNYDIFILF